MKKQAKQSSESPSSIEDQFQKVDDDFEELGAEEIKDAQEIGDTTIETAEIRKPRCKCDKVKGQPYCAVVQRWLKSIATNAGANFNYPVAEAIYFTYLKGTSDTEEQKETYEKNLDQITKDLERTFPGQKHFKRTTTGTTGITQLKNLLRAIAKRNTATGYVQGMNFIVGSLFFHSCEVVAFWVFDNLMNSYGVGKVYSTNLSGLHMHGKVIDSLIEAKYPAIWSKLVSLYISLLCINITSIERFRTNLAALFNRMDYELVDCAN